MSQVPTASLYCSHTGHLQMSRAIGEKNKLHVTGFSYHRLALEGAGLQCHPPALLLLPFPGAQPCGTSLFNEPSEADNTAMQNLAALQMRGAWH